MVERLAAATGDLTDAQTVGMRGEGATLRISRDDHAAEGRRRRLELFHLEPGHGQQIGQSLAAARRRDPLAQPRFRES
jgi:hypothetical protein